MPIGGSRFGGSRFGVGAGGAILSPGTIVYAGSGSTGLAKIEELDRLMVMNDSGISLYEDESALNERLREWFETPMGTVADMPSWGHPLSVLKFEPIGFNLNIMAEMLITEKLPRDIVDMQIKAVSVEFVEIDLLIIGIDYGLGMIQETVTL